MAMRVLVSGAGGLVGRELSAQLKMAGHEVVALRRGVSGAAAGGDGGGVFWNPSGGHVANGPFEGFDAVVHLAGEPILGRWTAAKKARIRESRTAGTRLLSEILAGLERRPAVLLTASAIGIYGDTGDGEVDESSEGPGRGADFLADVCRDWEAASAAAENAGIRVVRARLGVVLSARGGALGAMLPPFRLGLGGPVGSGRQWMSVISNHDVARAMIFLLEKKACAGAFNVVCPEAVTNGEFSRLLGRALRRPAILPVPPFAVKLLYGKECAEATVLRSARVVPRRLLEEGFQFHHPDAAAAIEWAVRH